MPVSKLAMVAEVTPNDARTQIEAAFRKCGAHHERTARELGVNKRTFARVVDALNMRHRLARLTEEAIKKGWHHGERGGRPPKVAGAEG